MATIKRITQDYSRLTVTCYNHIVVIHLYFKYYFLSLVMHTLFSLNDGSLSFAICVLILGNHFSFLIHVYTSTQEDMFKVRAPVYIIIIVNTNVITYGTSVYVSINLNMYARIFFFFKCESAGAYD